MQIMSQISEGCITAFKPLSLESYAPFDTDGLYSLDTRETFFWVAGQIKFGIFIGIPFAKESLK